MSKSDSGIKSKAIITRIVLSIYNFIRYNIFTILGCKSIIEGNSIHITRAKIVFVIQKVCNRAYFYRFTNLSRIVILVNNKNISGFRKGLFGNLCHPRPLLCPSRPTTCLILRAGSLLVDSRHFIHSGVRRILRHILAPVSEPLYCQIPSWEAGYVTNTPVHPSEIFCIFAILNS